MERRSCLAALGAGGAALVAPAPALALPSGVRAPVLRRTVVEVGPRPHERAVVLLPVSRDPAPRSPLVVLLAGYKQSIDPGWAPEAWRRDYALERTVARLRTARTAGDRRRYWLEDARVAELDRALEVQPYRGAVFVCPVTPLPYFAKPGFVPAWVDWLADVLLPAVRRVTPAARRPGGTGVGGVSMGGRLALEALAARPDVFAAVGAAQADLDAESAARLGARLASLGSGRSSLVLTAIGDRSRAESEALAGVASRGGARCELRTSAGPHTSRWVAELGGLELLFFLDRALGLYDA
ncbi:MAG: hypothetical protein IT376_17790 [Polyangiaceae bacterium]|nr:hypothetical protein [Polyangiaceae bacterium]